MENEIKNIKTTIKNIKPLAIPDYTKNFILRTDASNSGVGAVLLQKKGDDIVPIQWASKKLTERESKQGISEKEMFAVKWGIKNLHMF